MFPQLRLTPARAAFARPGPHATAFPDVNAPMQPSDSLVPFGRRSGRPSPAAYPGAQVLLFTAAPVPPPTGATPETFLPRLPIGRLSTRGKTRVSQVPGPSSSCVPWSSTPPGATTPRPSRGEVAVAFRRSQYLGHPETYFFRGYLPTAHSLACLRFAESVTVSGARLATGRAGSPFAGRVSHPLDDKQGFMKSSHTPFPLDQPCLTLHRLGPNTREVGTKLFEELLEIDTHEARQTLDELDSRFRERASSQRPRLARHRRSRPHR